MWTRRLRHGLRILLLTAGLIFTTACGESFADPEVKDVVERVAGGFEQQARAVQQTLPVGETLASPSGESLTVHRLDSELAGVAPREGERLIVIHLTVANQSSRTLPVDPAEDFFITTATGRRYQPVEVQGIPTGEIAPGQTHTGALAFSVAPDAQEPRFLWQQNPGAAFVLE